MTPRERYLADIGLIALRHGVTREQVLKHHSRCPKVRQARRDVALHFRNQGMTWIKIGRICNRDHSTLVAWAGLA